MPSSLNRACFAWLLGLLGTSSRAPPATLPTNGGTVGEVLDEMPRKRPGSDSSPWADDVQPDILGAVLRTLPCAADRASVRSVCRHWRAAASACGRDHDLPPPLPLLALPSFRLSCLRADGTLAPAREACAPVEVAGGDVRCVGSCDGWLVCVRPIERNQRADGQCFLVNAFSREMVHLPSVSEHNSSVYSRTTVPIQNVTGNLCCTCTANDRRYSLSLRRVVLSASPDSGSKYVVAALCFCSSTSKPLLAVWQPGMTAWYVCRGGCIGSDCELVFCHGKLFLVWRCSPNIFALELGEDEHGINVSRIEYCLTEPFPPGSVGNARTLRFNLVMWRRNLLWILEYFNGNKVGRKLRKVKVFALDCSTRPYGLTEVHNFDGDCIFVDTSGSKSFPASLHHGVEGDLIYFVKEYGVNYHHPASTHRFWHAFGMSYQDLTLDPLYDTLVYNMRDGTKRPFADNLSPGNFGAPENQLSFPVWCFPTNRTSAN